MPEVKLCPRCGKPARKKWCSDYCRRKTWQAANPEKKRAATRAWEAANPDRVRARDRERRAANREKINAAARARYAANPELKKASALKWQAANWGRFRARQRRHYLANRDRLIGDACRRSAEVQRSKRFLRFLRGVSDIMNAIQKIRAQQSQVAAAKAGADAMSAEQLLRLFTEGLSRLYEMMVELAGQLASLEERGVQVPGDRYFLGLLRQIGRGELLAEAFIRFGGAGHTLDCLRAKPIDEQAEILTHDDATVREMCRKKPKGDVAPNPTAARGNPLDIARSAASAQDLAELMVKMIEAFPDEAALCRLLRPVVIRKAKTRAKQAA